MIISVSESIILPETDMDVKEVLEFGLIFDLTPCF